MASSGSTTVVQAAFHVSPDGHDSADGSLSAPFRTPERAREAAAALIRSGMHGDIVVYLRGGTHRLDAPLQFGPESSGQNGFQLVFRSYPGERATISAGQPVSGWRLYDGGRNIYRAFVGKDWNFRQLYVNGRHAQRARLAVESRDIARTANGFEVKRVRPAEWSNLTDVEVVIPGKWMVNRCKLAAAGASFLIVSEPCWRNTHWAVRWGAILPAWIENAYEFLDAPGEWYLDRHSGFVYYIPRLGEDMSTIDVVAPRLDKIVTGVFAHDIAFTDIRFLDAGWQGTDGPDGYVGLQAGYHKTGPWGLLAPVPAALYFAASRNILFRGNMFSRLGAGALAFDKGSQNVAILANRFTELAAGAMRFGQIDDAGNRNVETQNRSFVVRDNTVAAVGFDYPDNAAVAAFYVARLLLEHNDIGPVPHYGISLGWGWGKVNSYAADNGIIANHVHDFSLSFHDSAGIYTLGSLPGTIIRDNYVSGGGTGYGCLYPDEGSAHLQWKENVCENVRQWLHLWTTSIHDNKINGNWTDTPNAEIKGSGNDVSGNTVVANQSWPLAARQVIQEAGIRCQPARP